MNYLPNASRYQALPLQPHSCSGLNLPNFSLGLRHEAITSVLIDALNTLKYLDLTTYKLQQIETILSG